MPKPALFALTAAALLTAVGLPCRTSAQVTPVGGGYLFRMKFTPGQTMRYTMTMSMSGLPNQMKGFNNSSTFTMHVLRVQGDKATIRLDIPAMVMNGQTIRPAAQTQITMDNRGQMVGGAAATNGLPQTVLPEKPLRIGQSFTQAIKGAPMGAAVAAQATYTLKGFQNVGGRKAAQLAIALKGQAPGGPQGSVSFNGNGTMLLTVVDGSLLRSQMAQKMIGPGPNGSQMAITMNMSVTRR